MKVRVLWAITDLSAATNATAKTTHRATRNPASASASEDGWEEHAIKNVQPDILDKIARRDALKICHQRRLAITLQVTSNADPDTSASLAITHAKRERMAKIVSSSVGARMAENVHILMVSATVCLGGLVTSAKPPAQTQRGAIIVNTLVNAPTNQGAESLMGFVFASLVSWANVAKRFALKASMDPTASRSATASEKPILFVIHRMDAFARRDTRGKTATFY